EPVGRERSMRFPSWWRRKEDLGDEIQSPLAMMMRDRVECGETAEQAERGALRELGNILLIKDVTRDMWGWTALERFVQDFRYTLRTMRKNLGFSTVAIFSLALGIGATSAIFTLTYQALLRMPPVKEPYRLVLLTWDGQFIGGTSRGWEDMFSYPMFVDL